MIQVAGDFTTLATPEDLLARQQQPDRLAAVDSLDNVTVASDGRILARFTPRVPLGRMPLQTVITSTVSDGQSAQVKVHGARGPHSVDATLDIRFERVGETTRVTWTGQIRLGGTAASVGQRVGPDIARAAIHEILFQLANA